MTIRYEVRGHIAVTTIDRPETRNAMDLNHYVRLAESYHRFRHPSGQSFATALDAFRRARRSGQSADQPACRRMRRSRGQLWFRRPRQHSR
jgi:hypothetical protein